MAKQTQSKSAPVVVAEICLYGGPTCGSGFIARSADGRMFGNGEPNVAVNMTRAIWLAALELERAGIKTGTVRVFDSGGERVSQFDLAFAWPVYGSMKWSEAPVYTISVDELERAAEAQKGEVL